MRGEVKKMCMLCGKANFFWQYLTGSESHGFPIEMPLQASKHHQNTNNHNISFKCPVVMLTVLQTCLHQDIIYWKSHQIHPSFISLFCSSQKGGNAVNSAVHPQSISSACPGRTYVFPSQQSQPSSELAMGV